MDPHVELVCRAERLGVLRAGPETSTESLYFTQELKK